MSSGTPTKAELLAQEPVRVLVGLVVAIVGGDEREQEIARLVAQEGAVVRCYGFPWPADGIAGAQLVGSAGEAMDGADYALFPVPGISSDGSLYAPYAPERVVPGPSLLGCLAPGAAVILGRADDNLREAAAATSTVLIEYEDDVELMLMRAPAVVEGVVATAVANSPVTLHATAVGVIGFGNIGSLLARSLRMLGSEVHVFARNPVQRAEAYAAACTPHGLEELRSASRELAMLFSTVPAPVVGREVLSALPTGSLVVDIAAPPGSIDLELARQLGHRAVWARGMGRSAPVTVGRSQWAGISRRIVEHQRRRPR